jgi:hypothetical protein
MGAIFALEERFLRYSWRWPCARVGELVQLESVGRGVMKRASTGLSRQCITYNQLGPFEMHQHTWIYLRHFETNCIAFIALPLITMDSY